jgi:hypothetical protein
MRRHDESHGRGPAVAEVPAAFSDSKADLEILFEGADFLADYPLRLVERVRWREVDESVHYDFRDLRGDHPLVPVERTNASTHRLEEGSLYFVARGGTLHRVTPVLVRANCPHCGNASTFSLDRYRRADDTPILKALEHRHTVERPDLAEELRGVGLLGVPA